MLSLVFSALTFAVLHSQVDASADRDLPWVINTAPPFHIVSGQFRNEGICDVLMDVVDEHLPDHNKTRTVYPQTRITQQFDERNQCFPCMIYRPESGNAVFTEPTHFYYPHGVITTKANATRMKARYGNPIALSQLVADDSWRFGYPAGRRYPALQAILESQSAVGGYRLVHTGENATLAILEMIKSNRIDYTIDYQILHQVDIELGGTQLEFIEIKETAGTHILGAIGCTNNAWGQQITTAINQHIDQIRRDPRFLANLDRWFQNHPGDKEYLEQLAELVWQKDSN
ncbi:MAG: ABC transporter substrate-binding protein [Firmicutes bacterium]|nr:ABC transporter substrate-binding protein [Gammaproteobacteria bacterium]MCL5049471.1 ABC transporter substrate-binding protein [Bacillota bacterium]